MRMRQGAKLLERESEIERLRGVVRRSAAGAGSVVLVEGEAGIGKTALLAQACRYAEKQGFEVLTARGGALERELAYGVVRQLLEARVVRAGPSERRRLLAGAAVLAEPVVAGGVRPAVGGPDAEFGIQHGLYWLTDNLASKTPLALVIDDAHWADPASLRFVVYLARRLEEVSVAVLIGWRTGEPGAPEQLLDALRDEPLTEVLRPAPLSEQSADALVGECVGARAEAGFGAACHAMTGGNPFLLSEVFNAVAQGMLAPTVQAAGRLGSLSAAEAVSRGLLLRMSRISQSAVALAEAVAVLDVDSELDQAAALAGVSREDAVVAAGQLARAAIFDSGAQLRFAHPILRGSVYGALEAGQCELLHARAAELLAGAGAIDRAAAHLLATTPGRHPATAEVLSLAGRAALERGAVEAALPLLERALVDSAPQERGSVLLLLGRAEQLAGRESASDRLRQAVEAAGDPAMRWDAARRLARDLLWRQRLDEAARVLEPVIEQQRVSDPQAALILEADRANFLLMSDDLAPAAGRHVERVAGDCAGTGTGERMVRVAAAFGRALATATSADETVELLSDVVDCDEEFVTLLAESPTVFWACAALQWAGRLDEARHLSTAALGFARRTGGVIYITSAVGWRAIVALQLGDLADAETDIREALEASRWFPLGIPCVLGVLIDVLRLQGRVDEAEAALVEFGLEAGHDTRTVTSLLLIAPRARLRTAQGRGSDAASDAAAVLDGERARGGTMPGALSTVARALAAAGDADGALDVARRDVEICARWGVPGLHGRALTTLGTLIGGAEGLELLQRGARTLDRSLYRVDCAENLIELGAALRRANRRQDAREPLSAGMALAHRCGARAIVERAREELLATGARPRRLVLSGAEALTASERRVARMAASGMTNREIAQALFVTRSTVETHLSHAYQKLDISSRERIGAALAPDTTEQPLAAAG